jgi:hypothetical protein
LHDDTDGLVPLVFAEELKTSGDLSGEVVLPLLREGEKAHGLGPVFI